MGKNLPGPQSRILRTWFGSRHRPLPWRVEGARGLRDPYRTWISEIMLQQTRVEAVIPYFEAFLRSFPDPSSLAAAPLEEVLKAWSGLGYYRRARMLHAAAKQLMTEQDGVFPRTAEGLRTLPGIGAYTSAAIASLAFGERVPVVDGNVKRVVARWFALELAADDPQLERAARRQGEVWMAELPQEELAAAGELNEALMELGATVCLPRKPKCGACPLAEVCRARAEGREAELPLPKKAKKWVNLEMVFLVQRVGVRVLLTARQNGWSPGLFEPPSTILQQESPEQAAATLAPRSSGDPPTLDYHGVLRHTITHHRIRAHVFAAPDLPVADGEHWLDPTEVPLTGLGRKVLQHSSR